MKTKEERFRELINDLYTGEYSVEISLNKFRAIEINNSKYQWHIIYEKDRGIVFIGMKLWLVFEDEYSMKYNDIKSFMKDMLLTHFKIKGKKPVKNICY